jgi:hypothetical protein
MVLCAKHGKLLPGRRSVMAQMVENRAPYYASLRQCDLIYAQTGNVTLAVQPLESLISELLKNQLLESLR